MAGVTDILKGIAKALYLGICIVLYAPMEATDRMFKERERLPFAVFLEAFADRVERCWDKMKSF